MRCPNLPVLAALQLPVQPLSLAHIVRTHLTSPASPSSPLPQTTDVYIFALAMGLSADPTLRPWYRETQRVATTLEWSAGVRAALLDPSQPAHVSVCRVLPASCAGVVGMRRLWR